MFFSLKTHSGQSNGGRALFRKRIWLRTMVLAGLGAMVVTGLCLLPGCGSDRTPGGSVKGKTAKTAISPNPKKMQGPTSLLVDREETGSGKTGNIQQRPETNLTEPIPGVTQEELDARLAADRKLAESPDTEVFPGMTQGELEARLAEDQKLAESPDTEIFPGMTKREAEARLAADKTGIDPQTAEVFPGMTQAQVEAQNAKQEIPPDNRELFPPAMGK